MIRTIKAALLFLVFALCALGAIYSPREGVPDRELKTRIVPVNNPQPDRGIWLRV